jgi:hypothetical protein
MDEMPRLTLATHFCWRGVGLDGLKEEKEKRRSSATFSSSLVFSSATASD